MEYNDELALALQQYDRAFSRDKGREDGRRDLSAWAALALRDRALWSVQREIFEALSKPRSTTAVPSCHSSGKTWLASLAALAFYDCYPDSKVITMSSGWEHLKDELWGEMRGHLPHLNWPIEGRVLPGALKIDGGPSHYIIGRAPDTVEGVQGYHAPHVLIIVDEATSLDPRMAEGLESLRAAGDVRLLIIFNPTDDSTWAYDICQRPTTNVIKISFDRTPNFTGEPVPPGADLLSVEWLQEQEARGHGPGTLTWETKVLANFWAQSEDKVISTLWFEEAATTKPKLGPRVLSIDLASFGDNENTIAYRGGNRLEKIDAFPSMRPDKFWQGMVKPRVRDFDPVTVLYDADGPGAGAYESAARACGEHRLMVVRGAIDVGVMYTNLRSMWWWRLRGLFERHEIALDPRVASDPLLKEQLCAPRYGYDPKGRIKIEGKHELRQRGIRSLDRADVVMYAFSFDAPDVTIRNQLPDRSEEAMWRRDLAALDAGVWAKQKQIGINPVTGVPDDPYGFVEEDDDFDDPTRYSFG